MPTSSFHTGVFVWLELLRALEAFVTAVRQVQEVKETQIGKDDVIVSRSADDGILYTKGSKDRSCTASPLAKSQKARLTHRANFFFFFF